MSDKLDPFDVAALERSLNDSATRVSTIWVSFLIFSLYLLTAATTVTHRQLFLAEPLKLPVLNIDLPLWGFFFLAPILFVLLHAYVLLQVLLLARTAAAYNTAVQRAGLPPEEDASLRQRLANTLFAQIFAGSPRERDGWFGWLLKAMAWITLAIAPVLILLVFQFMFLPYHSHLATWTHRLLIVAELAVAFLLWPLVLDARRDFDWASVWMQVKRATALPLRVFGPKEWRHDGWVWLRQQAFPMASCLLFVLVALSLATFPGEPHVNLFTGQSLLSVQCKRWVSEQFDRLAPRGVDFVDDEKLDRIEIATAKKGQLPSQGERTRDFRGRDLNCGTFDSVDLRHADFSGARMSDASFVGAQFQGAALRNAQLQGADLRFAQLQSADLIHAHLQGANLSHAKLQGANLSEAELQGADLSGALLQGANFSRALLQGASFHGAELQGADLSEAQLQGADLSDALLQGANFNRAQLQGANLQGAKLTLALLSDVFLWRAKGASCSDARTTGPKLDATIALRPKADQADEPVPATPEAIAGFIERVVADVSALQKDEVRERLRAGLVADIQKGDLAAIETNWRECAANSAKVAQAEYDRQHADFLRDFVCDATTDRKEIVTGIIESYYRSWSDENYPDSSRLARGLLGLDGRDCPATKELSNRDKQLLRAFMSTPAPAN